VPDVIQDGVGTMDFIYEFNVLESGKLKLKFSAQNLTDERYRWLQGGEVFQQWYLGRSFSIGTSYEIF
jgi:outer membrane receptor protein involved in Fe transport